LRSLTDCHAEQPSHLLILLTRIPPPSSSSNGRNRLKRKWAVRHDDANHHSSDEGEGDDVDQQGGQQGFLVDCWCWCHCCSSWRRSAIENIRGASAAAIIDKGNLVIGESRMGISALELSRKHERRKKVVSLLALLAGVRDRPSEHQPSVRSSLSFHPAATACGESWRCSEETEVFAFAQQPRCCRYEERCILHAVGGRGGNAGR